MAKFGWIVKCVSRAALTAAAISCAVGAAGCDPLGTGTDPPALAPFSATVPHDFVTHTARGGLATLRAPRTWRAVATTGVVRLYLRTDRPHASVSLVVVHATAGDSLARTMSSLPDDLRHEFAEFRLIKSDLIIINDLPAGRVVYEGTRGGFHGRLAQVILRKGEHDYVLTYTAAPDHYDDEYPAFEQVIASLKVL